MEEEYSIDITKEIKAIISELQEEIAIIKSNRLH